MVPVMREALLSCAVVLLTVAVFLFVWKMLQDRDRPSLRLVFGFFAAGLVLSVVGSGALGATLARACRIFVDCFSSWGTLISGLMGLDFFSRAVAVLGMVSFFILCL